MLKVSILNQNYDEIYYIRHDCSNENNDHVVLIGRRHKNMPDKFIPIDYDQTISRKHLELDLNNFRIRDLSQFGTIFCGSNMEQDKWYLLSDDNNYIKLNKTELSIKRSNINVLLFEKVDSEIGNFEGIEILDLNTCIQNRDQTIISHAIVNETDEIGIAISLLLNSTHIVNLNWINQFRNDNLISIWPRENTYKITNKLVNIILKNKEKISILFNGFYFLIPSNLTKLNNLICLAGGRSFLFDNQEDIEKQLKNLNSHEKIIGISEFNINEIKLNDSGVEFYYIKDILDCIYNVNCKKLFLHKGNLSSPSKKRKLSNKKVNDENETPKKKELNKFESEIANVIVDNIEISENNNTSNNFIGKTFKKVAPINVNCNSINIDFKQIKPSL